MTIDQLLETWIDAERTGDAATTAGLLTEDFVGIGPVGFQLPKPAWVGRLGSGELYYDSLSLEDVSVREYGEAALVIARWKPQGTARGQQMPTTRVSLSLVRQDGAWRIAGVQHSFIAGEPGSPGLPGQPGEPGQPGQPGQPGPREPHAS